MKIVNNKLLVPVLCIFLSIVVYKYWSVSEITCITYPNTSYTYIIVGAGTAGCVLAARLTENKENTVLLIEAGGNFNFLSKIPFLAVFLLKSKYDWLYESEPQKWSSQGFHNKKQSLARGKGLGGSGQLNFLVYNGIHSKTLPGLQENLIKFIRSKGCMNAKCDYMEYLLNKSSQLECKATSHIHVQKSVSHLDNVFKKVITQLNNPRILHSSALSTIFEGERWSTYRSHLLPAHKRANLHIMCNAETTKIIFDNKRAVGVQVLNRTIYSKSDVILSAGTMNTPKLLLLSGIGNKQELLQLNISTIVDLPGVGLNLHDHISMPLYIQIKAPLTLTFAKILNAKEIFRYIVYKNGVFASSPVASIVKTPSNFLILFMGSTPEYPYRTASNYLTETFRNIFPFYNSFNQEGFVILAGCRETKSRGFVKLNANKSLIIDPQYLKDESDVNCVKDAMKLAFSVVNSTMFQQIGASIHLPVLEQCNYTAHLNSDDYLNCIIRTGAGTTYHQSGTCKMGEEDDVYSVVDHNFRVKNIDGLRIVDGSILPTPSNNFPNAAIATIAEYAATLFT